MWTTIGQYVGGKVVTAILVVSSAAAVIWAWNNPEDIEKIWRTVKYAVAWIAFVIVLPWGLFFVTPWVMSKESNTAAALMLLAFWLIDVVIAFLLMGSVSGHSFLTWCVLLLGFLSAGVYNFKVCEFQAVRLEEA